MIGYYFVDNELTTAANGLTKAICRIGEMMSRGHVIGFYIKIKVGSFTIHSM
jgi:hypothetical protein